MATVLTHAVVPLLTARAFDLSPSVRRRLALTGAVCACLPDLDWLGALFDLHFQSPWGHRGVSHSLAAAALITTLAMGVAPPLPRRQPLPWLFLFLSACSHPLLDTLSHGEVGVALFAPLSWARVLAPFRPLPVIPLGVNEAFGRWGALVLAAEILLVWLPVAGLVELCRGRLEPKRLAAAAVAWAVVCAVLGLALPGFLAPLPRKLERVGPLDWVAMPGAPGPRLITRLDELQALGLLDRPLTPHQQPWSSSFFPWWYGGEAGRWQDPRPRLALRTLTGFEPPSSAELEALLVGAHAGDAAARSQLWRLAPTEKLDLAEGRLDLPATRQALLATHNGSPRYWFGLCNGVAAAALAEPEPFRAVEVINPRGDRVRFFPNDVKALLAASYFWTESVDGPRNSCQRVVLDSGAVCSMNAAAAVLATVNRLGLLRQTFLVDVVASAQSQYYAVASARLSVRGPPTPHRDPELPEVASLVDVTLSYRLSSTTLGYEGAHRPVPGDDTRFQTVGLVPVDMQWEATLGLDSSGAIVAGKWTGPQAEGPDTLFVLEGGPQLGNPDAGTLNFNPHIRWPLVQQLAGASVEDGAALPTVDLRPRPVPSEPTPDVAKPPESP